MTKGSTRKWTTPPGAPKSKEVQTPSETVRMAIAANGEPVIYSVGHTQQAARSKAKRIRSGRPKIWQQWQGMIRTGAYKQMDGTYAVYIGWIGPDAEGRGGSGPDVPWRNEENL